MCKIQKHIKSPFGNFINSENRFDCVYLNWLFSKFAFVFISKTVSTRKFVLVTQCVTRLRKVIFSWLDLKRIKTTHSTLPASKSMAELRN